MHARGIIGVAAAIAVLASGCTSTGEGSEELRDIREVVAEDAEVPSAEVDSEPPNDGPEATEHAEAASAEAPEDGDEPPEDSGVDITVVPDEITVEYVQAVVDELERILAEALVLMMEEGQLTIDITDRIGEIFTLEQRDPRLRSLVELADSDFEDMKPPLDIRTRAREVQSVIDHSTTCIYAETLTSDEAFLLEAGDPLPVFVRLETPQVERPVEINVTPWVFASLGVGAPEHLREAQPCSE